MHKKLKLGLARYRLIWSLEKADVLMKKLEELLENLPAGSADEIAILRLHVNLSKEFREYLHYLTK